ncbi:IS5 family transposase [Thermoplasmatales archaeon AK]|nr:IS5 family transposase [Thermoplasmatales archaeon AK]
MNLFQTGLSELYKEIESLGDPLTGITDRIDFERIRPMLSDLYDNNTDKGGRPNYDPVLMVKILLLQQKWYNLSDPQVEREIRDRISFMNFLGYPEKLPDRNTIWHFRERLSKTGKDRLVFNEIREQIMAKRIRIKKGTMQDASFIESNHGECGKPRGDDAKTRRSRDGASATKNIEKLSVTPANVHDSMIDLSIPGIVCYRDKGYFGSECKGINGTMNRAVRGHPLPVKSIRRNLRISRVRSIVEHPYAFFKGMFHFFHVMVTTVQRVRVKTYFTAICFNLMKSRYPDRVA